jgi:adenylyltransferase/sulfurtransferase
MRSLSDQEKKRYSRHLILPGIGEEGQQKLKAASVLVVGAGGLGSTICIFLAASGVGRIGVIDADVVDLSNLQRQIIHTTARVGMPKAESARAQMLAINPEIEVNSINQRFTADNARQLADGYQILVDGTDNFTTRVLINNLAVKTHRPYVYGAIYRFEGQASVFDADRGPCYRCLFPDQPPQDKPNAPLNGIFTPLPGTIATLEASETIKLITGVGTPLYGQLLLYNALEMNFETIFIQKQPNCPVCGNTEPV